MQTMYRKSLDTITREVFGLTYQHPDYKIDADPVIHNERITECIEIVMAELSSVTMDILSGDVKTSAKEYIRWLNKVGKVIKSALFSEYYFTYNYSLIMLRNDLTRDVKGCERHHKHLKRDFTILKGIQPSIDETMEAITATKAKRIEYYYDSIFNNLGLMAADVRDDINTVYFHLVEVGEKVKSKWDKAHDDKMKKIAVINEYKYWMKLFGKMIDMIFLSFTIPEKKEVIHE